MTVIQAFFQGILQGLTEFLPVSSSGHLSLFQYFTGTSGDEAFLFSVLLHLGTLVAVFLCFLRMICRLIYEAVCLVRDLITRRYESRRLPPARRTVIALVISTLPLAVMLLLKDFVSGFSTDNDITVEGFCFLVTALLLLLSSRQTRGKKNGGSITWRNALTIGAAQVVATMPGISRSGSTISAGLLCGLDREYAVSYSFILGIPAVLAATVLELKDALSMETPMLPAPVLLTGFFTALVFGVLSIKLVQWLVKGNKFRYFGYYMLALSAVTLILGFIDNGFGHPVQQFFMK